jgi:hypothetical protein
VVVATKSKLLSEQICKISNFDLYKFQWLKGSAIKPANVFLYSKTCKSAPPITTWVFESFLNHFWIIFESFLNHFW